MSDFIKHIKRDLVSNCFQKRNAANTAILGYDLGRANTEEERNYARKEWEFRLWAYECGYGIKEAMKKMRKYGNQGK